MDWIKRNLYFFVGTLVAVILMGLAGYYLYSKWQLNNEIMAKLNADYAELQRLNQENPHPGSGSVNNIEKAKQQQQQLRDFLAKSRNHFQRIPPLPDPWGGTLGQAVPEPAPGGAQPPAPKVGSQEFAATLRRTIEQLQKAATNSSIGLPNDFSFSFAAQKPRMTFASGSLEPLAIQLGEVKAICDILFAAKINSLDNIRRERVSADDSGGPATDYLTEKSVTNDLAILTPYEVTFRCFSSELAAVLSGFGSSPHGFLIKSINVELGAAQAPTTPDGQGIQTIPGYQPQVSTGDDEAARAAMMARRYGLRGRAMAPPPPVVAPAPATTPVAARGGLQTVLDEKQVKVTMMIYVIKLQPPKQ